MKFSEVFAQTVTWLQQTGRVSYRALKREFDLDDEFLADVTTEIIEARRLATDEDGRFLVWTGTAPVQSSSRLRTSDAGRSDGERRQLTVEFIDLVGSTKLSQQLDPEDYYARVQAYQAACHQVIERYDGYIAQYPGDGVLVYFGYPVTHEDEAQRAVRSGLEIVTAVNQLQYTPSLQARIGIHTGPVVMSEIGAGERTEHLALGETPNIAARVRGLAEPNTVVISATTYQLVQGLFECQELGLQTLKGISTPMAIYRAVGEGAAQSRFEVAVGVGLTPLVGREEELQRLRRCWAQVKAGVGQVVLLSGEAGIGKSRLVHELREQIEQESVPRIEFRCSPYHQNSALYPIIDQMQRHLQFAREDAPAAKLEKLQHWLRSYHFPQADTVALLAAFLSLPHPVGDPALTLSPQKQKQKTQEALVAWIVEEAERAPVYCAWEDLHWADPSTLELLTLYLDQVPTTRQLALLTFRSDFMPPWSLRSYFVSLTLSRLGRQQVETMVAQVTGGKALPAEVVEQIVSRTDGVPLFVEELTKNVIEAAGATGRSPLQFTIPATLHESLMARLDRLGPAKEVVQLGAALGREFSYELLQAVSPTEETHLQQALAKLVEAEVLYQRGAPPQTRYLFKHALIQDAAYQSLLKSKRQQYHQQIAQVLEERFPETKETQPELIAHHYTEAGDAARAVPAWQQAGQRAIEQSAFAEATAYWNKGLTVLNTLPETPDRDQQELQLHAMLGPTLAALKGYAAPDVERTYARALELCRRVGETPRLSQVLLGLAIFYLTRGELQTARQLGEQCLALAQQGNNPSRRLHAQVVLANILFYQGEFAQVEEHLLEGMTLYATRPSQVPLRTLQDPGINALSSLLAWTLWCRGYPDRAAQKSEESMLLAERSDRPLSQVIASVFASGLRTLRREEAAAFRYAEQAVSLATEQQFSQWTAYGTILRGWVLGQQSDPEAGIAQIHQGLAMAKAIGADLVRSWFLLMLAETYGKIGKVAAGLATIAEALEVVQKSGELPFAAEVHRMKGELMLRRSEVRGPESEVQENQMAESKGQKAEVTDPRPLTLAPRGEAESCFLQAIDLARTQHAKSWELRASTSLARLWQSQGKKAEAHKLLSDVYNWFTEGFDTKDLKEAKALLEQLA